MTGRLITLEGIDGAGKSSHLAFIAEWLRARNLPVLITREPGGTPLGETLRGLLLAEDMTPDTELLLMFAARAQHLDTLIRPALETGSWVVSDRFSDASYAYQCGGRGIDPARLDVLEEWLLQGFRPDLTLLIDVPPETAAGRRAVARAADRFERLDLAFFERVRAAYLERARAEPNRFRIIDGTRSLETIQREIVTHLEPLV